MSSEAFDPKKRRLCPDGACIGLLNAAGKCGECGKTFEGDAAVADDIGPADSADKPLTPEPVEVSADATGGSGGFNPKRKLCPDGACIGVIGGNGRCTECGKQAA